MVVDWARGVFACVSLRVCVGEKERKEAWSQHGSRRRIVTRESHTDVVVTQLTHHDECVWCCPVLADLILVVVTHTGGPVG